MLLRNELHVSFEDFLGSLHTPVAYLIGTPRLSPLVAITTDAEDLLNFLFSCKDENFLDVIELIFSSDISGISWPDNPLISGINQFLQADNLPYHLTGYVTEHYEEVTSYGSRQAGFRLTEYPMPGGRASACAGNDRRRLAPMTNVLKEIAPEVIQRLCAFLNDVCRDDSEHGFVRKLENASTRWSTVQNHLSPAEKTALELIAFQSADGFFSPGNLKAHYVLDEDFVSAGSAFVLFSLVASNWTHVVAVSNQNKFTTTADWMSGTRT